jgi:hypothetical protein
MRFASYAAPWTPLDRLPNFANLVTLARIGGYLPGDITRMTGAPGFLEFFILEASDYVEQLDG